MENSILHWSHFSVIQCRFSGCWRNCSWDYSFLHRSTLPAQPPLSRPHPNPSPGRFWKVGGIQRVIKMKASQMCLGQQAYACCWALPRTRFTTTGESLMMLSWDQSLVDEVSCLTYRSLRPIRMMINGTNQTGHWAQNLLFYTPH